ATISRPARAAECCGHHRGAAVLGLGVGWHGIGAGHSDHRGPPGDLRSHRFLAAHRALAERLTPASKRSFPRNRKFTESVYDTLVIAVHRARLHARRRLLSWFSGARLLAHLG